MIVGITGTNGAGKDTVAARFVKSGFKRVSLSDIIREELASRGLPELRENTAMVADELRKKDLAWLSKRSLEKIKENENAVVVSIRTPAEVSVFRDKGDFTLIAVDALPNLRYERNKKRRRDGDEVTFEYFLEHDKKERGGTKDYEQQIDNLMKVADIVIDNNGSEEEFDRKITTVMQSLGVALH